MKQQFDIAVNGDFSNSPKKLAIEIGNYHYSYAILTADSLVLEKLLYYQYNENTEDALPTLLEKDECLNQSFENVSIVYDVSMPLTDNQSGFIAIEKHRLVAALQTKFPTATLKHISKLLADDIVKTSADSVLRVDFRQKDFTVLVGKQQHVVAAHNFEYGTPEDVLYYLLKLVQNLGLNQTEVVLVMSGLIDENSSLYKEIYQYFTHGQCKGSNWNVEGIDYPAHYFTTLNSELLCE